MMTTVSQLVAYFAGSQLPSSFSWYWDAVERQSFYAVASPSSQISFDGYTHTLLFATHTSISGSTQLLLGLKLRGFGAGTYNGIGGKVLPKETTLQSILREAQEEIHVPLSPQQLSFAGRVAINVDGGENVCIALHTTQFDERQMSQVKQSEEMQPHWFDIGDASKVSSWSNLPMQAMRPEHKIYLALLLHYAKQREHGSRVWIDVHVEFDTEPSKEGLASAERPENHRTVRQWSLNVIHNQVVYTSVT